MALPESKFGIPVVATWPRAAARVLLLSITLPVLVPAQSLSQEQAKDDGPNAQLLRSRFDSSAAERRWAELRATYLGPAYPAKDTSQPEPESFSEKPAVASSMTVDHTPEPASTEVFSEAKPVWANLDVPQHLQAESGTSVETALGSAIELDPGLSGSSIGVMPASSEQGSEPGDEDTYVFPIPTANEQLPALPSVGGITVPLLDDEVIVRDTPLELDAATIAFQDDGSRRGPDISDRLKLKPISSIVPSHDYAPYGEDPCQFTCPVPDGCADARCPDDVALPERGDETRTFPATPHHWAAANVRYNPLYFEDARLERYGHHIIEPLQSIKSVGLFAAQFASLPYQMAIDPAHSNVSPLGFYRPGEAAPCLKRAVPINGKAAVSAAATYTGLIFLIP